MIIVLLADGFEEIEALTPVDMLRRAGLDVKTVGMNGKIVCGSHKIPVICDLEPSEINKEDVSLVIFPGGMPGSLNLDAHPFTDEIISSVNKNGGRLAAICAAPLVLGRRGLLKGKKATCYPGFENELLEAVAVTDAVVTDGNITTSRGMGTALAFAKELITLTKSKEEAETISKSIMEVKDDCRFEWLPLPKDTSDNECESSSYLDDEKFLESVELALATGRISTALIQRKLAIGYGRAAKYIDIMEDLGIASEADGAKPRYTLITAEEWHKKLAEVGIKYPDEGN